MNRAWSHFRWVNRFKSQLPFSARVGARFLMRTLAAPCHWLLLSVAILACPATLSAQVLVPATTNRPTVLTNIQAILALQTNIVAGQYEARVRGVVTYVSPSARRVYIQDQDAAIQVNSTGSVSAFQPGHLVEVNSRVGAGRAAPYLVNARLTRVGEAPLPEPFPARVSRLRLGENAGHFVSVRAVVRDMISSRGGMSLMLSQEARLFEMYLPVADLPLRWDWLDAEIEARGVSDPLFSSSGRPTGFRLYVQNTNFIQVIRPGESNLFDRPLLTIAEASRRPEAWQPRIKVAGTVLAHRVTGALFIQDATGVMRIELMSLYPKPREGQWLEHEQQTTLQPGERVEVIGVRHNWFSLTPTLILAEYRRIGHATPPAPRKASVRELQTGHYPGHLVTMKARLLDFRTWAAGTLWYQSVIFEQDNQVFSGRWEGESAAGWNLKPGSYVSVTAVNEADRGQRKDGNPFQLLLRSPEDISVLPDPPFWARPEARRILFAAGSVGVIAAAWILLLGWQMRRLERRVADRTADLRGANERLQSEVAARQRAEAEARRALAQEKELHELKSRFVSMVSHEFRTPLAIIMSSAEILDAYLDRLPAAERAENLRDIANATRHMGAMMDEVLLLSRVEAGKMAYRPARLDLAAFCERLVDETISATSKRCPIHLSVPPGLPEATGDEALLRHIFINLLNNAVKYSPAGSPVAFSLESRGERAVFTVRDEGIGIPEADARQLFQAFHRGRNVGAVAGNGLGLVIVKSCVELHHGDIVFETREGHGSTFVVSLPLFTAVAGAIDRAPSGLAPSNEHVELTQVP